MSVDAALALAGLAVALTFASGLVSLGARMWPHVVRFVAMPLLGLAGVAALMAGVGALIADGVATATIPLGLPWMPWQVRLDALAGFFLIVIGALTAVVGLYGPAYVRGLEQGRDSLVTLGGFTGLFVAGMLLVVLADDVVLFMIAWELMSLASYVLVAFNHEHATNRRAAFLYLLTAQIGGLAILLGFSVLTTFGSGGLGFDALRHSDMPAHWASLAFGLALVGFGMKAGLVPLHAWLPEAHPAAPSHISALMSGVMLKVAVYGFMRFVLDLIGDIRWEWGVVVLALGATSALAGALFALVQTDLKRLLAYSSVENLGIVFIALGLALVFLGTGHRIASAVACTAALYHALNHTMFKGLLFLGAGAILHSTHERDLQQMGGLLGRMPWTGFFMLIGCLSIAALPPFNGFVSEWLLFQSALQSWQLEGGVLRSLIPIVTAILALTSALVAATFVKAYGTAFLGHARSRHVRRARRGPWGFRAALGVLAVACILLGILPLPLIQLINEVPRQLVGATLPAASAPGWLWLAPVSVDGAGYDALTVALLLGALIAITGWVMRRGGRARVRRCDLWDCGFAPATPAMQISATGFAQPLRRVFGLMFRVEESTTVQEDGTARYQIKIEDPTNSALYRPSALLVESIARHVVRLQSGNIRAYLAWTLITLLILLWIVTE
jgi:formate hydrogenlyase subunit 3/multisubunit Na+/H+ antiporter MnhD subunit